MISLKIGTNTERKTIIVEPTTPLGQILDDNAVNTSGAALYLNGTLIAGADLDESLADLDIKDGSNAALIAVVKADSAN